MGWGIGDGADFDLFLFFLASKIEVDGAFQEFPKVRFGKDKIIAAFE